MTLDFSCSCALFLPGGPLLRYVTSAACSSEDKSGKFQSNVEYVVEARSRYEEEADL